MELEPIEEFNMDDTYSIYLLEETKEEIIDSEYEHSNYGYS